MANEYAVNSADLTAVADAIRAKGGTSEALAFPGGFVSAVEAIQAGGGDSSALDDLLTREIVNIQSNVTKIGDGACKACKKLVSVDLPLATLIDVNAFNACSALESVSIPQVTKLNNYAFLGCSALKNISMPNVKTLNQQALEGCTSIEDLNLPAVDSVGTYAIKDCTALKKIDLHAVKVFYGSAMIGCTVLDTLIIRSASVPTLHTSNILNNTAIKNGNGHIYVPSALLASYQTATNWAVIYGDNPDVFHPLEGSEYE